MADPSRWRGRKVLVTGCSGFLGGAVARELLARGATVVGLVHQRPAPDPRVTPVRGSADNVFRLHSAMAVHEVAAVFHLAGTPLDTVLQAASRYSRRVPIITAKPPVALTDPTADERVRAVRCGEVFGPGDRRLTRVVPAAAIELLTGSDSPLPPDGPARDFAFVRDVANALIRAADAPAGESAFGGHHLSDRQMIEAVRGAEHTAGPLAAAARETVAWYAEFLRAGSAVPVRAAA